MSELPQTNFYIITASRFGYKLKGLFGEMGIAKELSRSSCFIAAK